MEDGIKGWYRAAGPGETGWAITLFAHGSGPMVHLTQACQSEYCITVSFLALAPSVGP